MFSIAAFVIAFKWSVFYYKTIISVSKIVVFTFQIQLRLALFASFLEVQKSLHLVAQEGLDFPSVVALVLLSCLRFGVYVQVLLYDYGS